MGSTTGAPAGRWSRATQRWSAPTVTPPSSGPAASLAPHPGDGGWTGLERDCVACHTDPHDGALSRRCTACHDAARWEEPVRFDHARTDYPLTGRHERVACNDCHLPAGRAARRNAEGEPVPVYRPLPHTTCADCHRDPHQARLGADCASCHQTTSFTAIRRSGFDHERTRYPLRGRHTAVRCEGCHDPSSPAPYTPAFARCADCHADAHAGTATLGGRAADCAACHSVAGFSPASFAVARHDTTRYPLEGRHRSVACAACHVTVAGTAGATLGAARVALRPAYAACTDCHGDDHAGQLRDRPAGGRCDECHTPGGWTPVSFGARQHADLVLPLVGAHAEVACAACHAAERAGLGPLDPARLGRARVAFALPETACADCHRDPHDGRFTASGARPVAGGCEACHDAAGFRPAAFDPESHAPFGFALEGAHGAVPCAACHEDLGAGRPQAQRPGATLLRSTARLPHLPLSVMKRACADCHANPHEAQFAEPVERGCDACHTAAGFAPAGRFDHDRDSRFRLTGAHERVACSACHRPAPGNGAVRYRPLDVRCESCHGGTE